MADEDLGTAHITVELDTSHLGNQIERAILDVDAQVDVQASVQTLRESVTHVLESLDGELSLHPDVVALSVAIEEAIDRLDPELDVRPDLAALQAEINAAIEAIDPQLGIDADLDRLRAEVSDAIEDIDATVQIGADLTRLRAELAEAEASLPEFEVEVNVDRDRFIGALADLRGVADDVTPHLVRLLQFGAVGIAAAGAAQGVGAFVAALAPAAGAIAALPAVIIGAQVAMNTFRLAVLGVGDAFSAAVSGDEKKFEKALESLSPAARKAALEVKALAPELKAFQQSIQDTFFSRFTGQITKAVTNLAPLRDNLRGVSGALGDVGREILKVGSSSATLVNLQQISDAVAQALTGVARAVQPVAAGFLNVGSAVAKAFGARVGDAIFSAGSKLGAFLNKLASTGRAVELVANAVTVFKQLGSIVGNVGSIIKNTFSAANAVGGGLLNNLVKITAEVKKFTASDKGQEALRNVFTAISQVAAQLGPILGAVVTQLGKIAPLLTPVLEKLGPGLMSAVTGVGQAVTGVLPGIATLAGALSKALGVLVSSGALQIVGQTVGSVVSALAPLLPLIASVASVLVSALGPALQNIAAFLQPVIAAISTSLVPLFTQLAPLIVQVTEAFRPIFEEVGAAVGAAITQIATAFQSVLDKLTPFLPQIKQAGALLIEFASNELIIPFLTQLIQFFADLISNGIKLVGVFIDISSTVGEFVGTAIGAIINLKANFNNITAAIQRTVTNTFNTIKNRVVTTVQGLVNDVVSEFSSLIGRAQSALSGASTALFSAGQQLIEGMVNGVRSAAGDLVSAARSVVDDAISAAKRALGINSPSKVFHAIGEQTGAGLVNGLLGSTADVRRAANRMAEATAVSVSPVSVPGSVSAGSRLATTLVGGEQSRASVRRTAGQVVDNSSSARSFVFNITEAGNGQVTAQRILDRLTAGLAV